MTRNIDRLADAAAALERACEILRRPPPVGSSVYSGILLGALEECATICSEAYDEIAESVRPPAPAGSQDGPSC